MKRLLDGLVDFSGRRPFIVLMLALAALAGSWFYASHLELHSDFLELLPRDSPGFKAYEHQLGRVGGGASLVVVVESPERKANERYIDELRVKLDAIVAERAACIARCANDAGCQTTCPPALIGYIESGTKDVRKFFEDNKWLYADLADLEDADRTLDRQIAVRSGLVENILEEDESPDAGASADGAVLRATPSAGDGGGDRRVDGGAVAARTSSTGSDGGAEAGVNGQKKAALGMDAFRDRWKAKSKKHDDFPTGYFATEDGTMLALRIVSQTTGTGDRAGDILLQKVDDLTKGMKPASFHPAMRVGLAGDIPNAVAEKDSIASEAKWATLLTFACILAGVAFFYRSAWALGVIAMPAALGVGAAYSFAMWRYGYVNTTGAFLGAIILGNGINYPIVLLSRYREFRSRGMPAAEARRTSVSNALRAELVGACVGAIAYGSLTVTRFRGFNQFGMIGFVGMLLVWVSMIPCVPALIVAIEWIQGHDAFVTVAGETPPERSNGPFARAARFVLRALFYLVLGPFELVARLLGKLVDMSGFSFTRALARVTERRPWIFVTLGVLMTIVAVVKLPSYFRDPWEYDFDKLGSRGSRTQGGAGEWSSKADKVFAGKMSIAGALMLADSPEQVPLVKAQIFKNDAADPNGKLVSEVATVADLLPGTADEQKAKLEVLDRIRDRLTERVLYDMPDDERARVLEIKPPETIHPLGGKDLPALLRRRFEETNGMVGTIFYVKYFNFATNRGISYSDGHTILRIAKTTDNVTLPDGTVVQTASRSTVFAEMIRSMERDGPLATFLSFASVVLVVIFATHNLKGAFAVILSLLMGVLWMVGGASHLSMKLNFLNFIALPITFGIGCEYPFNIYDRSRLLGGDVRGAVERVSGAVILCSFTTTIGYGSLLGADNQALQSFGTLAMSGEIACIVTATLFMPSLLHLLRRRSASKT